MSRTSTFEPDMETVQVWIDDFLAEGRDLQSEFLDIDGDISNNRLWQKESNTQEEIDMFEQNIADLEEYLEWLKDKEIEIRRA